MLRFSFIFSAFSALIAALTNLSSGLQLLWIVPVAFIGTYISLILLLFLITATAILLVDVKKPPKKSSPVFRFLIKLILEVLIPLLRVKVHTTGLSKVPTDCRFLLVSNHLYDFDPAIFMHCLSNTELGFVGKKEIYQNMKFIAKAMHKLHGLPIDRENPRNAVLTINAAAEKISSDTVSIGIFPEGYCSLTGELLPFRNGAFKIAKKAHCPIVVATIKNTKQILKNMFIRKTDVYVDVLEVVSAETVDELSTAELSEHIHKLMYDNLN